RSFFCAVSRDFPDRKSPLVLASRNVRSPNICRKACALLRRRISATRSIWERDDGPGKHASPPRGRIGSSGFRLADTARIRRMERSQRSATSSLACPIGSSSHGLLAHEGALVG